MLTYFVFAFLETGDIPVRFLEFVKAVGEFTLIDLRAVGTNCY